jgi:(2R)-sulfolactate sulfo-lyase subunit alpha
MWSHRTRRRVAFPGIGAQIAVGRSSPGATGRRAMIDFVVHDEQDSVGVVVVEGAKAGQTLTGWVMEQDSELEIRARQDIPIGHKVAITALRKGDTVIKYGVDIGRVVADIEAGEHAHVHNIKTKRW